jgi:hypothetical protein
VAAAKKAQEFEYRLIVSLHANERLQKTTTLIRIETIKPFTNFQYDLSVHEIHNKRTLSYKIRGLKTPQLDLPSTGPAQFTREYVGLRGKYHIIVEGLDGTRSECDVSITRTQLKLVKSPKTSFIEFIVA